MSSINRQNAYKAIAGFRTRFGKTLEAAKNDFDPPRMSSSHWSVSAELDDGPFAIRA
jgi:hypothetical protein